MLFSVYLHIQKITRTFAQEIATMTPAPTIEQFTPNLFWDIAPDAFDIDRYPAAVVERVLERGEWNDWCLIRNYLGLQRIAAICKTLRTLSPESLNYICCLTHTDKKDYRCYHFAQSNPTLWNS